MIEIRYGWKLMNDSSLSTKVIGIGYHQGNTNFGQSDLITLTEEIQDPNNGAVVWASMLFTSGKWYRQVCYLIKKYHPFFYKSKAFPKISFGLHCIFTLALYKRGFIFTWCHFGTILKKYDIEVGVFPLYYNIKHF